MNDPGPLDPDILAAALAILRARVRAQRRDMALLASPSQNLRCGHGGCPSPATRIVLLASRPGLEPDSALQACEEHEPELALIYYGLEPVPQ